MSLAGAQGSLWSVEGGNRLVCSGLLKLTKANVIHATVTTVTLQPTGRYTELGPGPLPSCTVNTSTSAPQTPLLGCRSQHCQVTPEGTVVLIQMSEPGSRDLHSSSPIHLTTEDSQPCPCFPASQRHSQRKSLGLLIPVQGSPCHHTCMDKLTQQLDGTAAPRVLSPRCWALDGR